MDFIYCVGGCSVFGKISDKKEAMTFFEEVFAGLDEAGIHEFEFSVEDSTLRENMLELFPDKEMGSELEYSYRAGAEKIEEEPVVLKNCKIVKVDATFLKHLNETAVDGDEIIGIIMGTGRYEKYLAIDIWVKENRRREGIAAAMAKDFLVECGERGICAQWDCVESNIASRRLAEGLGFQLFKKRPYHWFGF